MKFSKLLFVLSTVLLTNSVWSQANTATDPNIIFFIVDDLGYYDLEIYNDLLGANARFIRNSKYKCYG
ncbi:hypothetical protein [Lacinutrix salivirga]